MWCFLKRPGFRLLPMLLLGWLVADWAAGAKAQEILGLAPVVPAPPPGVPLSPGGYQEFLDRLGAMEQRLDQVTKQNEDLRRENKALAAKAGARDVGCGVFGSVNSGAAVASQGGVDGQIGGAGDASERGALPTGGAQEVDNLHLGKVPLSAYYDFDAGGFHVATQDKE